jgi:NAD(P)H-quinone oxidoreductase subunit 3
MPILPKYESFWVFLLITSLIPVLAISSSALLAPTASQNPEKRTSYESGIEPMGESWIQFQIRYYMFALVFVVFDVETVFLYPWAMSFDDLGIVAFAEVLVFVIILIIGLIYAWRKGALEWS